MTVDISRVQVDLQEQPRWRRTLSISVPAGIMKREHDRAWAQFATRLELPGFRKGTAPSSALERQYGQEVRQEMLERVIAEVYRAALADRGIRPVSQGRVETADYQPGGALSFQISFDVRPTIEVSRLDGFEVVRPNIRVDPSDVERTLQRLLEENAIWLPPDDDGSPHHGDLITVQIVPLGAAAQSATAVGLPWAKRLRLRPDTTHRGRYQFVLGQGDAVPDLERAVASLVPGQTGEFVVFDDAAAEPQARELRLRVTLEDRRMRELPELDDAFARSLGNFKDVNELRDRVRDDLEEEAAAQAETILGQRLLDQALAANPFEAPRSLVEESLASMAEEEPDPSRVGQSLKELRAAAEVSVKRALLLDRIAESMGLAATSAEVDARVEEIASLGQVTPDQVRARLAESNRLEILARDITERKVIEFLRSRSVIVEQG